MPSSTNVGGTWRNISNWATNVGGTWRNASVVWNNVAGVWKRGWSAITFKAGLLEFGSSTKAATYVNLYEESAGTDTAPGSEHAGNASMTTVQTVDLTSITNLQIDWEYTQGNGAAYFIASTVQIGSIDTYNARFQGGAARTISSLNVSSLSGMFYIRVHVYSDASFTGWAEVRVYRILLDGAEVWNASNAGSYI